jgi:hypothetical protein
MRAIALFVIFAFTSIIAAGFMAANTPASAGKVNGKPGCGRPGCSVAQYGGIWTSKPPAKTKKPATAQ